VNFKFKIELIIDVPPTRAVVGKIVDEVGSNWSVGEFSKLDGKEIHALTFPPRALNSDGSPRLDLVAFQMKARNEIKSLSIGQVVLVENLVEIP
jgi:hypothetical protein